MQTRILTVAAQYHLSQESSALVDQRHPLYAFTVLCVRFTRKLQQEHDVLMRGFVPRRHINGYVAVPEGHPWYGLGFDDIDAEVHGGITYTQTISHDQRYRLSPPEGVGYWVVGFDTAHASDTEERWPFDAVVTETMQLLSQAYEADRPTPAPVIPTARIEWSKRPRKIVCNQLHKKD